MARPAAALAWAGIRLDPADLVAAVLAAAFFVAWQGASGPIATASWLVLPTCAWWLVATGDLLVRRAAAVEPALGDAATKLLVGLVAASSWLYVLAWISPAGIRAHAAVGAGVVLVARAARGRAAPAPAAESVAGPGTLALLALFVAATLWSRASLAAIVPAGDQVLFRPWLDAFVHATDVRMFRDARGAGSIEDIRMAGIAATPYHFASYLLPALVSALTRISAYRAFVSFCVPAGVLMSGLGAYLLARTWFGGTAALAAAVAVAMLPDAAQHGLGNPFLGYHWLLQTSPTLAQGLGVMALAWALVFVAIRTRRWGFLAAGWAVGLWAVNFKAQLAVAGAPLLVAWPALAMPRLDRRVRAAWLAAVLLGLGAVLVVSAHVSAIPELRFDPASTRKYLESVCKMGASGEEACERWFARSAGAASVLARGAWLVVGHALGLFLAAYALVAWGMRRRAGPAVTLFPAAVVLSYAAMTLGLGLDRRRIGTPEELLHRPFVLAYFVVVAWTAAALVASLRRDDGARRAVDWVAVLVTGALTVFPLLLGPRVARGPSWGEEYTDLKLPAGLVAATEFLRQHAGPGDVVLDGDRDPWMAVTALSERRPYVVEYFVPATRQTPELSQRLKEARRLPQLTAAAALHGAAARAGITWYVSPPGEELAWPDDVLERPAYASEGFRVYRIGGQR